MAHEVQIGSFKVGAGNRPFLIAGPCVIESEQLVLDTAGKIAEITKSLGIPYVFKSSFDKANRTWRIPAANSQWNRRTPRSQTRIVPFSDCVVLVCATAIAAS